MYSTPQSEILRNITWIKASSIPRLKSFKTATPPCPTASSYASTSTPSPRWKSTKSPSTATRRLPIARSKGNWRKPKSMLVWLSLRISTAAYSMQMEKAWRSLCSIPKWPPLNKPRTISTKISSWTFSTGQNTTPKNTAKTRIKPLLFTTARATAMPRFCKILFTPSLKTRLTSTSPWRKAINTITATSPSRVTISMKTRYFLPSWASKKAMYTTKKS